MEMTQNTLENQNDKRINIKTCIVESWKVFALNTKQYFKYLWFHFVIAGFGFAFFSAVSIWFVTNFLQPTQTYIGAGYDASLAKTLFSPSGSDLVTGIVALLAFILANCLMFGAVFSQIRFYKATDTLPAGGPFTFWKEVKKDAIKSLTVDIIFLAIQTVLATVVATIAHFTSLWVLSILIPITIYWLVIGTTARLQYVTENKTLKIALKDAFTFGHQRFGGYFILIMLTSIPMLLITYAALLPSSVIQLSLSADTISKLTGDPSGMPPYILPLYLGIATLGYFLFSVAYSLQQWPLALYTSAVCKKGK